jgi:hypothetical protein
MQSIGLNSALLLVTVSRWIAEKIAQAAINNQTNKQSIIQNIKVNNNACVDVCLVFFFFYYIYGLLDAKHLPI